MHMLEAPAVSCLKMFRQKCGRKDQYHPVYVHTKMAGAESIAR